MPYELVDSAADPRTLFCDCYLLEYQVLTLSCFLMWLPKRVFISNPNYFIFKGCFPESFQSENRIWKHIYNKSHLLYCVVDYVICELLISRVRRSGCVTWNMCYSIFIAFLGYTGKQTSSETVISKYYGEYERAIDLQCASEKVKGKLLL